MQFFDIFTVIGVHLYDAANAFFLVFHRVIDAAAFGQHAGIDPHEGQLADERVGHQLEGQRRELFVIGGPANDNIVSLVMAFHRWNIQR
ncbi:hypothetical protein D3C80_1519780 [compost metagenome]